MSSLPQVGIQDMKWLRINSSLGAVFICNSNQTHKSSESPLLAETENLESLKHFNVHFFIIFMKTFTILRTGRLFKYIQMLSCFQHRLWYKTGGIHSCVQWIHMPFFHLLSHSSVGFCLSNLHIFKLMTPLSTMVVKPWVDHSPFLLSTFLVKHR